jgi:hypothetical protein
MEQSKIEFLKQATALAFEGKRVVKCFASEGEDPMFIYEISDVQSLNMTDYFGEYDLSPVLKIINLLGQCRAKFNTSPIWDDDGNFVSFDIQVEDVTPLWNGNEYKGKFELFK